MKEMQENKKKQKLNIFIVILLIITIVASSIVLYAWSKYTSSESGEATAQVAKWHFDLSDGDQNTENGINFPITRTDGNVTVADGKIAPGTSGVFEIDIDTTDTEVSYVYDIDITITNCPTNLKFYENEVHTSEFKTERNNSEIVGSDTTKTAKLNIKKYVPVKYSDAMYKETIYWDWEYETLDTVEEGKPASTEENDKIDTEDQGKEISMSIIATGTEVMEKPSEVQEVKAYIDFGNNLVGTEKTDDDWAIFYEDEEAEKDGKKYVYAILTDYLPVTEVSKLNIGLLTKDKYVVYLSLGNGSKEKFIQGLKNQNWNNILPANIRNKNNITVTGAMDIETWIKSWNSKGYTNLYIKGDNNNGYCVGNTDSPNSYYQYINGNQGYYDTLYFPHRKSTNDIPYAYWLSSTSAYQNNQGNDNNMMCVYASGAVHYSRLSRKCSSTSYG